MKIIACLRWRLGKSVLEVLKSQHEIVYVLTDTKEIIEFCNENSIPFINPSEHNWERIFELTHDIIVSCMFNKIIRNIYLNKARYGGINIHQSLLPLYRGKSPVIAALLDNQKSIGFTIHYMNSRVDSGDILFQTSWYLDYELTLDDLMNQYMDIVPNSLLFALKSVENGNKGLKQNEEEASYCSDIKKNYDWGLKLKDIQKELNK